MRCPDCHQPIVWVPQEDGRRIAITVTPDESGGHYLDQKGVLRPLPQEIPADVPRYVLHVPCPEVT